MKKVYIFWMIIGALSLGIAVFLYFKGQDLMRYFAPEEDDIDYIKG